MFTDPQQPICYLIDESAVKAFYKANRFRSLLTFGAYFTVSLGLIGFFFGDDIADFFKKDKKVSFDDLDIPEDFFKKD